MMRVLLLSLLLVTTAFAQQVYLPLTGWRAQLDQDLSKIAMSREAHGQVMAILQAAERQAQLEKQKEETK